VDCQGTAVAAAVAVEAEHACTATGGEEGGGGDLVESNGRGRPGVFGALARRCEASPILRKNMLTRLIYTNFVKQLSHLVT
jgi:hypothetical protein